jgi:hypothetical protein
VRYEPAATARHAGGSSAPRPTLASRNLASRIEYLRAHERGPRYLAFRLAYVLHELVRLPLAATRSGAELRGRLRAVAVSLGARAPYPPDVAPLRADLSHHAPSSS